MLPAAIDKKLVVKKLANGSGTQVNITASDLNETFSFNLNSFSPIEDGWPNYACTFVFTNDFAALKPDSGNGTFEKGLLKAEGERGNFNI